MLKIDHIGSYSLTVRHVKFPTSGKMTQGTTSVRLRDSSEPPLYYHILFGAWSQPLEINTSYESGAG